MPIKILDSKQAQANRERVKRWREQHRTLKEPDWRQLKAWLDRGNKIPDSIPLWGAYTKYVRSLEQRLEKMTKSRDFWISKVKPSEARLSAEKEEKQLAKLEERIAEEEAKLAKVRAELEAAIRADTHYYDRLKIEQERLKIERERFSEQNYRLFIEQMKAQNIPPIPIEVWRYLMQWAHPDKHRNSEVATQASQWLLNLKPHENV